MNSTRRDILSSAIAGGALCALGGCEKLVSKLTEELGQSVPDSITAPVMTEFGRRIYENTSAGTDHGRGFALMAMGEKINGGKVHGAWPGLKEEPTLPGPGGMEVRIDYRAALSEILAHAVGNAKINEVFPGFVPQRVGISG